MKSNKFIFLGVLLLILSMVSFYGYFPTAQKYETLDTIEYTEGELSYYKTRFKYRRKKRNTPLRKYLYIYLQDDSFKYVDGDFLLDNMEQNAFVMQADQYPRPKIKLGVVNTDDSFLKEVYDIQFNDVSIVDVEGIRGAFKAQMILTIVFGVVLFAFGCFFIFKYVRSKKNSN